MDKSLTTKILTGLLVLFLVINIISQFVIRYNSPYKTEIALRYDSTETIEFDGVFIRDEHLVSRSANGVIRYRHQDGSKLGINSVIADVYSNPSDIEVCMRLELLQQKIASLKDAQNLAGTDNSQLEAFNKLITEKHSLLIKALDSGDYSAAAEYKYQLLNLQCKRDMAKGKAVDYTNVISSLQLRADDLQSSISAVPGQLLSDETGYFVSTVDGYEGALGTENADKLTPEEIQEITANPVKSGASPGVIGKMIESYRWKIAAVLDDKQASAIEEGALVQLVVGAGPATVSAQVLSAEKHSGGDTVVIFSCYEPYGTLSSQRTERFKLLIDSFNGIRISASAIHFDKDNNIGVYTKNGVECRFKKIKTIFSGDGYVIAEDTTAEPGYLSLYDTIITEGKDLYDGKIF